MSQDTFPFATGEDTGQYADADAGNKKKLMIAGGAVAALVLGAGVFLMGGGGSEAGDEFIPRAPRVAKAAAAPQTAVKTAVKKLPVAYEEQIGRDPFKALYVVPVAAPAAAAAPGVATTTTSSASGGSASTTTSDGDTASTTATQASAAPSCVCATRYALKLVSISQTSAEEPRFTTWSVDGQKTTVLPAQRFGKYGELVVLAFSKNAKGAVDKAILQVGDDSPIEVAVGESNNVL